MKKPAVVISFLGGSRDRRNRNWRPTFSIAQHAADFIRIAGVSSLHKLIILDNYGNDEGEQVWNELYDDCRGVCKGLEIVRHSMRSSPWDIEETLYDLLVFADDLRPDTYQYFVHTGAGTHVGITCLYILTDSEFLSADLLQTIPPEEGKDRFKIISPKSESFLKAALTRRREHNEAEMKGFIDTKNPIYNQMITEIQLVAVESTANILIQGETGVGKTYLAQKIAGLRKERGHIDKFHEYNCATIRGALAASELFGHVKGSFTGAVKDKTGILELADNGLLFLDEIGELGLAEQAMLLKAIEEKEFIRVGDTEKRKSNFQLICGTNRNLKTLVKNKRFREDLLARIGVWKFTLPPLRERPEDMEAIFEQVLAEIGEQQEQKRRIEAKAKKIFLNFATSSKGIWPGNLRDMRSAVLRMSVLAEKGKITQAIVEKEITKLIADWEEEAHTGFFPTGGSVSAPFQHLLAEHDLFEVCQLEIVASVCKRAKTLSEAGRILYNMSRKKKKQMNDASRLREYLLKFDYNFSDLKRIIDNTSSKF